jgi:glyoxylase-like metal-dependent hydrolase (beta-lactamase superfamily II)
MKHWQTKSGIKIYQVLARRSNAYLILTSNTAILVDTGKRSSVKQLLRNLSNILHENQTLDYLILTHTHFDHCQNAARLQKQFGCKIVVSEHEQQFLSEGNTPLPKGTNFIARFLIKLGKNMGKLFMFEPFKADIVVTERMMIPEGNSKIEILLTPGHSAGSLTILVDNEIAIVGDTLFGIFPNSVFPPFADDVELLHKSWKSLLKTSCQLFLPGHGKAISRSLLTKKIK